MTLKKKKIIRISLIVLITGLLTAGGIVLYMFNMPHRNVQNAPTDFKLTASELVIEYLENTTKANEKYLAGDGDSKILEITGTIRKISDDFNDRKVVLLQSESDKAGVSCSFTAESDHNVATLTPGQTVTIKGVIRSGASYDIDLGLYENIILEKSDIVRNASI